MGNFKIKSIWENKNTGGGNVPTDLANRVQELETNAVKITGDQSIAGNKTFTQPLTVATPTANTNATTKEYVDNKIQKRVYTTTNTQGNTHTIQPTNGYEILNVMVGRKRTSDSFYFFQSNINLNFQVFLHTDGKYKVYTQGPANDFGPDFRIIVVEMKV